MKRRPIARWASNSEIASLNAAKDGVGGTSDWPWPGRSGATHRLRAPVRESRHGTYAPNWEIRGGAKRGWINVGKLGSTGETHSPLGRKAHVQIPKWSLTQRIGVSSGSPL